MLSLERLFQGPQIQVRDGILSCSYNMLDAERGGDQALEQALVLV
jgi:hypothetical protein